MSARKSGGDRRRRSRPGRGATTTSGAIRQPSARKRGQRWRQQRRGMALHRACRQAVGDDEHDVVRVATGMRRQRRFGVRREPAAEIGPHQVVLAVLDQRSQP